MFTVNIYFHFQEYPPGVTLVPMRSRTAKPFDTTNLVVFAPDNASGYSETSNFVAHGDALIVDPGCCSQFHKEVWSVSLKQRYKDLYWSLNSGFFLLNLVIPLWVSMSPPSGWNLISIMNLYLSLRLYS